MTKDVQDLTKPAVTDIDQQADTAVSVDELSFNEKLAVLEGAVTRHPLNREILYRVLGYCAEERSLQQCENNIASYPEFATATQNPYSLLSSLVRSFGLELIERDAQGNVVSAAQKEGLSEDELDDLVCATSYRTTEVGSAFYQQHTPQARLVELLQLAPERSATYIELLQFLRDAPRSYVDIEALLRGRPVLETVIDGVRQTMQPSVFVDKLERAGVLIWKGGWSLTHEGEGFLENLQAVG